MLTKVRKHFTVVHPHYFLHHISLYNEILKESSAKIEMMIITGNLVAVIFCFKKFFFVLKIRTLPKEVTNGQHQFFS